MDIDALIDNFVERRASDLYVTFGAPLMMKVTNQMEALTPNPLTKEDVDAFMRRLVSESIINEFESTLEYNTAISWRSTARLRINLFRQRQENGMVIRRIHTMIPTFSELGLPSIYGEMIMEKRGLILVVGPTGSGKSTSLACMLEYRNQNGDGHIVTVEDPIEYVLEHKRCIITQRDVGIDTYSFSLALKNALRQAPDVIVIGEIRDRETMEQAITFSETGHLCLATLHAQNANQAVDRIINFFPQEKHKQVLLNLSIDLKAIFSQRLVKNLKGQQTAGLEILLNQGLIRDLIRDGKVKEIKECIERGTDQGMQTFDQHLIKLYDAGIVSEEMALIEADNPSNLRLALKQRSVSSLLDRERVTITANRPANF
jgi:twitching motility protein PilU